jgi:ornithine carbamoyltransferase
MKRDLISLKDYTSDELSQILKQTHDLKKSRVSFSDLLKGRTMGLIFQKPSNRTRVSFEVGIRQLGGDCIYLGPDEINLGKRESTRDVAKTLSRYLDGIVARTFSHDDTIELAKEASVPVINGLSDLFHPCQALADVFSIEEHLGSCKDKRLAYIGDGNNVCHSLLLAAAKVGMSMVVATPKNYEPQASILENAAEIGRKTGAQIQHTYNPVEAVQGSQIIYADVWTSMGQEAESAQRLKHFKDYQINKSLVKKADPQFLFMHCLPAHRGEEVTADIIDGTHSIVFDQAENRMHVQKAILVFIYQNSQIGSRL